MLALVLMLLAGIAMRWRWISSEVAGAFRERFTAPTEQTGGVPAGRGESASAEGAETPEESETPETPETK